MKYLNAVRVFSPDGVLYSYSSARTHLTVGTKQTTMKHKIYLFIFLILTSCGQSSPDKKPEQRTSAVYDTTKTDLKIGETESAEQQHPTGHLDNGYQDLSGQFDKATVYKLTDTIAADFNGDGIIDRAIFTKAGETSGLIITHGRTNEKIRIGLGESFAHLTDLNWVDYWGLVMDSETFEVIIKDAEIVGDRKVRLEHPSIVLRREEEGGGLITFKNGEYVWIHQAD